MVLAFLSVTNSKIDDPWPGADGSQHGRRLREFGANGVLCGS